MLLLPFIAIVLSACIANAKEDSTNHDQSHLRSKTIRKPDRMGNPSKSGNPFAYPCTSNNQCEETCHMTPSDPNTWFCDCYWSSPCSDNEHCCTNICNNGYCATTGGTQGALCNPQHLDCGAGYICQPWGDFGYCDAGVPLSTPITTGNPYLLQCTYDNDCQNSLHLCENANQGVTDPNGWVCECYLPTGPCSINADCCSNICLANGTCADGGGQGTVCRGEDGFSNWACAPGCQCIPFDRFGYCQC